MEYKLTNLLIIALEFPPLNVGGSKRPFYFAKHLTSFGVKPIIATLNYPSNKKATDHKLLDELSENIKIIRFDYNQSYHNNQVMTRLKKIRHYFKIDDLWGQSIKKSLIDNLKKITISNQINIVLITIPPFSTPRFIIPIFKELKIPIILDMRDHYSLWVSSPYATYLHFLRVHFIEKYYLQSSNIVIVVSDQMKEDLLVAHPSIPADKIQVIPNGISQSIPETTINTKIIDNNTKKYVIGYSGQFYFSPIGREEIMKTAKERKGLKKLNYVNRIEDWKYRSPYYFFKTLHELFKIAPQLKEIVEFQYAGEEPKWLHDQLVEFDLLKNYKYVGFLNSTDVDLFHKNCDALLITSVKIIGGKDHCIAGKTFSYLEAGKPILGFVTEGEQKEMLKSTGMGIIFDPDNTDQSVKNLLHFFTNSIQLKYNSSTNEKYLRVNLAEKLSKMIHYLIVETSNALKN